MKKLLLITYLIIWLISCRKEAKVKLPQSRSVPVVYCFISPNDTILRARVYQSMPLYKTGNQKALEPVQDATVTLSDFSSTLSFTFNTNNLYYEKSNISLPIQQGKSYKIQVILKDGTSLYAETTVPTTQVMIQEIISETINEQYGSSKLFRIKFNDEPGKKNYYRLCISAVAKFFYQSDTSFFDVGVNEFASDNNNDGTLLSINARFYPPFEEDSVAYYRTYLLNCSSDYYHFHYSLKNYNGTDPFSEPSLIYTNVKGGLGCFGAYTQTMKTHSK